MIANITNILRNLYNILGDSKTTLLSLGIILLTTVSSFSQVQLHQEDFETDGSGVRYTTVELTGTDAFFQRKAINDADIDEIATPVAGAEGSFLWAVGDLASAESSVTIDNIDITGYSNISLDMLLAANSATLFEDADYLIIEVRIDDNDPGAYTTIGAFYGSGTDPNAQSFRQDADLSGTSATDNASFDLTETLTNKNFTVTGIGSTLDIRIRVLNSQPEEQIVFDDIRVSGSPRLTEGTTTTSVPTPTPTSVSSMETTHGISALPQLSTSLIFDFNIAVPNGVTRVKFDALNIHLTDIGLDWGNVLVDAQLRTERIIQAGAPSSGLVETVLNTGFSGTNNTVIEFGTIDPADNEFGDNNANETKVFELKLRFNTSIPLAERILIDGANINISVSDTDFNVTSGTLGASSTVSSGNVPIQVTGTDFGFHNLPTNVTQNADFTIVAQAEDPNGNRDIDNGSAAVTLAKGSTGTGNVTSATGLVQTLSGGIYTWTDVQYDGTDNFTLDIGGTDLTDNTSASIAVTVDNTSPTASAPTNTSQTLMGGVTSTSTVESNEAGAIYLYLSTQTTPTNQTEIDALVAANNAFLGEGAAAAATPYTITPLVSTNDGLYNIVAVDQPGNVSASVAGWLTVDNTDPIAFTTGSVITAGGTIIAGVWNATNTGVNVMVPIDNDASIDGGTLQIRAQVNAGAFENLAGVANILTGNLGATQTVAVTAAQLQALTGYAEGVTITFNAIIADISGNATTGTVSGTTLLVDEASPAAFTTGSVITTGGTIIASVWNVTNTGVNVTVPIDNDPSIDGGDLQIRAQVNAGAFQNLAGVANILTGNLGATQTVAVTAAQLQALTGYAEGVTITFNAIITDVNGNNATTGTASSTTLLVDEASPTAFTTGSVITTGGTVLATIWNSTNTGVDVTVPIANDVSIDGGTLQIRAQVNAGPFQNLASAATIITGNLGGNQTVSITDAQLQALTGYAEGATITFNAIITDVNGNTGTTGTVSTTTLTVDEASPAAFTTGSVITTSGTVIAGVWNATNTGVNVTVPIDNDVSIDGGDLQIRAQVNAGAFENLAGVANILTGNLGATQTVAVTAAQLQALTGYAEGVTITFNAIIADVNGNATTGTVSGTTLLVDEVSPAAFTTGSVITTGGTVIASVWNATNTGVNVTVPIDNDPSIDGGDLRIRAQVNAGVFQNLAGVANILTGNLGATQTVAVTAAQLQALTGYAEGVTITFNAIITDVNGNNATTGTASGTTLLVDEASPTAFTTGSVITTGGTVLATIWNSTNTDVEVTVPIANDVSIDGGTLQIRAQVNAGAFQNLASAATILTGNLGGNQTVSITDAQLQALTGYAEGVTITFNAIITDVNGNTGTTGTVSTTTLTVDEASPAAFTTGSVITTGGTVVSTYWNATNTGVDVTVPIANDLSIDGGTLQIRAQVDAGTFENLAGAATIINGNLGGSQTVNITAAQLETLSLFAEGSVITFNAIITDTNGNPASTGTISATTLAVDQAPPVVTSNEFSVTSSLAIEFTMSEELLPSGAEPIAISGFTTGVTGTFSSADYSGKGTTNVITINGTGFAALSTTVSYTPAGTILDLAGNEMVGFSGAATTVNAINLSEGDIAITSYDSRGTDGFAFVLLKDTPIGTKIKFTDRGWKGTVNESFVSNSERVVTWEATSYLFAGTEITVSDITVAGGGTLSAPDGGLSLSSDNGDQLLAYQGTDGNPTFLFAIQMDGNTWDSDFNDENLTKSALPRGLTQGLNALVFANEMDNGSYDRFTPLAGAITSGTPLTLLTAIGNPNNWDRGNSSADVMYPTAGPNYTIPPDLQSSTPTNSSIVSKNLDEFVLTYDAGEVLSLFSGNVHLNEDNGTNIATWNTATDAGLFSIVNNVVTLDISSKISFNAADDGKIYEVDIDALTFENTVNNRTEALIGDTDMKFTIDGIDPIASTINRGIATPLNASFGTNATSVTYVVTFSEPVQAGTVATTDFTTAGTASGGTETISGISGTGTTYTLTVSGINKLGDLTINFSGAITDVSGNIGSTSKNGDQSFIIINPEPSEQPTVLSVVQGADNFILDLSWTAGGGSQLADGYLILYKTTAGTFPTDPTDLIAQGNIFNGTNGVFNSATNSASISGLASGTQYDFKIYPYTNSTNQIDYKIDGTVLENSGTTGAGEESTITPVPTAPTTIASTIISRALVVDNNITFNFADDANNLGIDNAPTQISSISYTPGGGNAIAWVDAIEGVELLDGLGNFFNSDTNPVDITISNTEITFTNIPNGTGQIGEVLDNAIKTYSLRIWLKNPISDAALQNTIDNNPFTFDIARTGFTFTAGSSGLVTTQSNLTSSTTRNRVDVTATDLNWEIQPPATTGVLAPFTLAPVIEAIDAYGNRDENYFGAVTSLANTGGISMNNNPDASGLVLAFNTGIYTFDITAGTGFNYQNTGNGTLTMTSGTLNTSPASSLVTVSYSDNTTITAGAASEPAIISSLYNTLGAPPDYVLDFDITDDAGGVIVNDNAPTRINQIVINAASLGGTELATNWNDVIANAMIFDGSSRTHTALAFPVLPPTSFGGSIGSNSITFSSIPNSNTADLGYIADGTPKNYSLFIWLKTTVTGGLNNTMDNQHFNFDIDGTDITVESASSTANLVAASVTSGVGNNEIQVLATELQYEVQPSNTFINEIMSTVTVDATDVNGNRDLDRNTTVSLTSTGTPTIAGSATITGGTGNTTNIVHSVIGDNLTLTVTDDSGTPLTQAVSSLFNIAPGNSESDIIASAFTYEENIPYKDFVTAAVSNTDPKVFQFDINDGTSGGTATDLDALPTNVTSLSFDIGYSTSSNIIQTVGLFNDSNVKLAETIPVLDVVTFDLSGAPIVVGDDGTETFHLRATFNTTVIDKTQFSFTVSGAVANNQGSNFENGDGARTSASAAVSSTVGPDNRIEVDHILLTYNTITGPSLNTSFQPVVSATDNFNNTDIDFIETIDAFSNTSTTPGTPISSLLAGNPNIGDPFVAGVYTYPVNFQFTQTGEGVQLFIETATYAGSAPNPAGESNSFDIETSQESYITNEGDGGSIPYLTSPPTLDITNANSYAIAEFLLHDGNPSRDGDLDGNGGDEDGANTVLNELTITITNSINLDMVGIFDASGTQYGTDMAAANSITFTGLNFVATDNLTNTFFVKASFKNNTTDITDDAIINVAITAVVEGGGSQFEDAAGGGPQTTAGNNRIDVIPTSYVFVSGPGPIEGISRNFTVRIEAQDTNGNIESSRPNEVITFSSEVAGINRTNVTLSNGFSNITNFRYTSRGYGTLTATGSLSGTSGGVQSTDVIGTDITQLTTNVAPDGTPLLSGFTNEIILAFELDARSNTADEPVFNNITFTLSNDPSGIFENFRLFKQVTAGVPFALLTDAVEITGASVSVIGSNVDMSGFSEILDPTALTETYYLVADVSAMANEFITPVTDVKVTLQDSFVSQGSLNGVNLDGFDYSFIDTKKPEFTLSPVNNQINVPNTAPNLTIIFDEAVTLLSSDFKIFEFAPPEVELVGAITGATPNATNTQWTLDLLPGSLVVDRKYYVTFPAGDFATSTGFIDIKNFGSDGIPDKTGWAFTTADALPPNWLVTSPVDILDQTFAFGFDLKVQLNEPGKVYYVVLPDGATPPTADEYFGITPHATEVTSGSIDVLAAGLDHYIPIRDNIGNSTPYDVYLIAEDDVPNRQDVLLVINSSVLSPLQLDISTPASSPTFVSNRDFSICAGDFQTMFGSITLIEGDMGDLDNATDQTFEFALPSGFEFYTAMDAGQTGEVTFNPGNDITTAVLDYRNSSIARVTFTTTGTGGFDDINVSGLRIKADQDAIGGSIELLGSATSGAFTFGDPTANLIFSPIASVGFTLNPSNTIINTNDVSAVQLIPAITIDPFSTEILTFSGTGVIGDSLFVQAAGVGTYPITLTYQDENKCQSTSTTIVEIVDTTIENLELSYCADDGIVDLFEIDPDINTLRLIDLRVNTELINTGNVASLLEVGNNYTFDPAVAASGGIDSEINFRAIYEVILNTSLRDTIFQKVNIFIPPTVSVVIDQNTPGNPDPTIANPTRQFDDYCEDRGDITIIGSPSVTSVTESGTFILTLGPTVIDNAHFTDNGDGTAIIDPQLIFDTYGSGIVNVRYLYNDANTCSGTADLQFNLNPKPLAGFDNLTPDGSGIPKGCDRVPLTLTNTSTVAAPSNIIRNFWNFDDVASTGGNNVSNQINPSHSFTSSGEFDVNLIVITDKFCTSEITKSVAIGGIPQTSFNYAGTHVGQDFTFESSTPKPGTLSQDNISQLIWDYGDGSNGSGPLSVKNYGANISNGSVSLTAISTLGCDSTTTKPLVVLPENIIIDGSFPDIDAQWVPFPDDAGHSWARGKDNNIDPSTDVWVTGLGTDYLPEDSSAIYSPSFDISALERPLMTFDSYWALNTADGVVIQYSVDNLNVTDPSKEWEVLGEKDSGLAWYNFQGLASAPGKQTTNDYGWSEFSEVTDTDNWSNSKNSLSEVSTASIASGNNVIFRFIIGSVNETPDRDGFAFKNFVLGERTRTVLVENFTNTFQTNDVSFESKYLNDTFVDDSSNGVEVIKLNYHTDFPGEDPVNTMNPTDHGARAAYYDISFIPQAIMDGNKELTNSETEKSLQLGQSGFFSNWGKGAVDQRSLQLSEFDINIVPSINSADILEIIIDIDFLPSWNGTNDVILNVALVENDVNIMDLGVNSGETVLYDVVRDLLPNAAGTLIPNAETYTSGGFSRTLTWVPNGSFDLTDLSVVAFIQDEIDKTIYQAEISSLVGILDQDDEVTGIDDIDELNFSLYPNPATDQATISFGREIDDQYQLKVYDHFGKLLHEQIVNRGTRQVLFDTSNYINGFYFIQVESSKKIITRQKLVIMKQ